MWKRDWIQDPVPTNSCREHQQEKSLRGKGNFTFVLHPPISSPLLLSGYPSLNMVLWSLAWTLPWFWRGEPRAQYRQDGFLPHTISRYCFLSFHWKVHTMPWSSGSGSALFLYHGAAKSSVRHDWKQGDLTVPFLPSRSQAKWSSRSGISWRPGDFSSESH